MDWITIVYLAYMFIALYFLFFFIITFIQNKNQIFLSPKTKKTYSLSVAVPAYNEEKSIEGTVLSLLNSDYKGLTEIIVINDGSTDDTLKIAKNLEKKYSKVRVLNKKNSGKADSINQAIKLSKGELFAVVDADSYPEKNAISSMIGFFDDADTGAVTTRILVKERDNFIRNMQSIEYKVITFTRKLLDFVDAIYVTPGPLAIYRKSILLKMGGFDSKNMTEDIEATWHIISKGYKVRMSFVSRVFTVAPDSFKKWYTQRIRWNIGGTQTLLKYRKSIFKKGMLSYFVIPFFAFSLILGVFGLGIFTYRIARRFLVTYLTASNSIYADTAIIHLSEINLNPSILNFFGVILFLSGILFTYFCLKFVNGKTSERDGLIQVLFYSLVYITAYPMILIVSIYKMIKRQYSWR